eukprot:GILJ01025353.1.p1 GENE.GILJ01025353.1~~GILJ01025353.1.p1  ORF type:complete len:381 (+),score=49.71 GILJ01025353.1:167-1144(+)
MAIASSIVDGDKMPIWAAKKSLFDSVVSAACRELERVGDAKFKKTSRAAQPTPQLLVTNPSHPLHYAFRSTKAMSNNEGDQVPPLNRLHTTLEGFAQHILTKPSRFPHLGDDQRVALMASALNAGNKVGVVRKGLEATSLNSDKPVLPSRRKWLWDLAVLLCNKSLTTKARINSRGLFDSPSVVDENSNANISTLSPAGLVALWRLLNAHKTSKMFPIIVSLHLRGTAEHHQEHNVRRAFWDSRVAINEVDALLGELNPAEPEEVPSEAEAAERRDTLTALVSALGDDNTFQAVVRHYMHGNSAPPEVRKRCEQLLKAEGVQRTV